VNNLFAFGSACGLQRKELVPSPLPHLDTWTSRNAHPEFQSAKEGSHNYRISIPGKSLDPDHDFKYILELFLS